MNFFESQDVARKKTGLLVFYFVVAVLLIILAVDSLVVATVIWSKAQSGYMLSATEIKSLTQVISLYVCPSVILVIGFGMLLALVKLQGGGIAVAELVKARPLDYSSTNFIEKRFINVVEEISIASGVPVPKLYVLDNEDGINAFVAGIKPEDTVMVVTKGALNSLNRDELQGVIGHEYSHILNSDMVISVRLIALLSGILMLSQLGYYLLRIFGRSRSSSSSRDKSNFPLIMILIGFGLLIIGYIGLFFGRLIKAAISRQRELLADASSVAYTRNPEGLVNALRRIDENEASTLLTNSHAEDISHLCFTPSTPVVLFKSLLATHPSLSVRIKLLDPEGLYSSRPLAALVQEEVRAASKKSSLPPEIMLGTLAVLADKNNYQMPADQIPPAIGQLNENNIAVAQILIKEIPLPILDYAHDPKKVDYLLWALVFPKSQENIKKILPQLEKLLSLNDLKIVLNLHAGILVLNPAIYLPLIDIALPSFKQKTYEERKTTYNRLEKIASLDNQDLFDFVLLAMIAKAVSPPKEIKGEVKYEDFTSVLPELCILMSLVVSFGQDSENQIAHFEKAMKQFTDNPMQMVSPTPFDGENLKKLLDKLNQLSPLCKEKVIQAIIDCIESDNIIKLEEAELIRGIATCLDCPIPLLLPNNEFTAS